MPATTVLGRPVTALECRKNYRQIFMARPVVPLSNKDIGYLPGDIQSKLDPYMQPLYDNLGVIKNQYSNSDQKHKRIDEFLEEEKLVVVLDRCHVNLLGWVHISRACMAEA